MPRNHWTKDRSHGEARRPVTTFHPVPGPAPADTSGIWYVNKLAQATGDVRIYAVLGLYCHGREPGLRVGLIIDSGMSAFMQAFLQDCHVRLHFNDGCLRSRRRVSPAGAITTPNYGTFASPGNLFQFQRDILVNSPNVPIRVRELRNLVMAVPAVRRGIGAMSVTPTTNTLVLHVKTKAYIKNTLNGARALGVNYHEEHKLSYSLALAVGKIASSAGWRVFINDDEDRLRHSGLSRSARALTHAMALLLASGYSADTTQRMMGSAIAPLVRDSMSLFEQYRAVANLGTLNVRHLGGRSGHLEFMMYLGQRVYYVEEPGAQGANRIATTLGTLVYRGQTLMNRCILIPTTAGGRAEMEYRYEEYDSEFQGWAMQRLFDSNPGRPPRQDGALVRVLPRVQVPQLQVSVDPYKVQALLALVDQLGLPRPP